MELTWFQSKMAYCDWAKLWFFFKKSKVEL